jgi:hypothetical protein
MTDNNIEVTSFIDVPKEISEIQRRITNKHKRVSNIPTPKPYIKKKAGMEYVEISYMRDIADKEYPGWSWTIKNSGVLLAVYEVHGRLKWYDEGIWRKGDMVAGHKIQKKRGIDEFVDISNDIKASNTDCMKKAFNMFMNIADDVYRKQVEDFTLSDQQKDEIIEAAALVDESRLQEVTELVKDQAIHNANYKSSLAKLQREAK